MPKIIFLIGMPGSGKTTYKGNFLETHPEFGADAIFDDFHANAIGNSPEFTQSKHYRALVDKIKSGRDCMIADIEYCVPTRLNLAETGLKNISTMHNVEISFEYKCFENNPFKCRQNVMKRLRQNYQGELSSIARLTQFYQYPVGAEIIQISN